MKTPVRSGGLLLPLAACLLLGALAVAVGAPVLPCPECEEFRVKDEIACFPGPEFWRHHVAGCRTCSKRGRITLVRHLSFR